MVCLAAFSGFLRKAPRRFFRYYLFLLLTFPYPALGFRRYRTLKGAQRPNHMKVHDSIGTGFSGLGRTQDVGSSSKSSGSRGESGRATRSDQVSLSSLSGFLSVQQPDSQQQTAKIAQLSAAVGAGRYSVDAQALSGSIIQQSLRA